jgi:hypothetical protein
MHYSRGQIDEISSFLDSEIDPQVGMYFIGSIDVEAGQIDFNFLNRLELPDCIQVVESLLEKLKDELGKADLKVVEEPAILEEQGNKASVEE